MNYKKQLVSNSLARAVSFGTGNPKKFITVHQTGNPSRGANAQTHANLQSRGFSASWHWQVDDKEAIQSFDHTWRLFHAGDGRGKGNMESIGIESCINSDGDYVKAVRNTAKLVAKIMKDEGIPISRVVQHNYWSGKNCPAQIRAGQAGINWNKFIGLVKGDASGGTTTAKPKPQPAKKSIEVVAKEVIDGKWGNGSERKSRLEKAGYNYTTVQNKVNALLGISGGSTKRTGKWRFNTAVKIRSGPSTSHAQVGLYKTGDTVNLDGVETGHGYIWGTYIAYSGARRYVALQPVNGTPYGKWI